MRALITGIAGFAGSHLTEFLLRETDVEVAGVLRAEGPADNIDHVRSRLRIFTGDVCDYDFLAEAVASFKPNVVFHLAAQAAPSLSFSRAQETLTVNVLGQYNMLEAVARQAPDAVVLVVGSGDEYGVVKAAELPVREENPLRPSNPYSVSKIAQDMLGYQFHVSEHLHTVRVRPFNHIGPRQTTAFAIASFARQVAEIEAGAVAPTILVGNLEPRRDISDVRDVVRGYWLAVDKGIAGEVYNIGTGKSWRIADLVAMLLERASMPIDIRQDPSRIRPTDALDVICDPSKFREQSGWEPMIPIEQSLTDILNYWRERVRRGIQ